MALNSKIEWATATWNPVTGCTKISPGCQNCYAERMAKRLKAMHNPSFRIKHFQKPNAQLKFISFEPLLSKILNIDSRNINWVIVGGESGLHSRPMGEK